MVHLKLQIHMKDLCHFTSNARFLHHISPQKLILKNPRSVFIAFFIDFLWCSCMCIHMCVYVYMQFGKLFEGLLKLFCCTVVIGSPFLCCVFMRPRENFTFSIYNKVGHKIYGYIKTMKD